MEHDPFGELGLPATFELDPAQVDRAYLARVAALHPDLAGDDAEVQARSAALNQARDALRDPERRAGALLRRLGGPDKSQDKSLPDGFLVEMLEVRELIEEATRSKDPAELERWQRWAAERRAGHIARVAALFREAGPAPAEAARRAIRRELNAWRYAERLIEQLDPEYDPARSDFA